MIKQTIALFDFDGTITTKDTFVAFIKFSKGAVACYSGFLLFTPLLIAMKLRLYPNWKAKQKLFAYFFKGETIDQFEAWGCGFATVIDKLLRQEALGAIERHRFHAQKCYIVSASIENWIRPWADRAGFEAVIATKIEVDGNGRLTGRFSSKNCHGQEKVNRVKETIPDFSIYKTIAYGDSNGDRALLAFADEAFYRTFG